MRLAAARLPQHHKALWERILLLAEALDKGDGTLSQLHLPGILWLKIVDPFALQFAQPRPDCGNPACADGAAAAVVNGKDAVLVEKGDKSFVFADRAVVDGVKQVVLTVCCQAVLRGTCVVFIDLLLLDFAR